jgi:hypothetical protein
MDRYNVLDGFCDIAVYTAAGSDGRDEFAQVIIGNHYCPTKIFKTCQKKERFLRTALIS